MLSGKTVGVDKNIMIAKASGDAANYFPLETGSLPCGWSAKTNSIRIIDLCLDLLDIRSVAKLGTVFRMVASANTESRTRPRYRREHSGPSRLLRAF